jgi:hypothetical protein
MVVLALSNMQSKGPPDLFVLLLLRQSSFTASARGAAVTSIVTHSCVQHIDVTGRRPGLVIFAAMVALVVNWTTTIGIFLITCEAVIMQRTHILRVGLQSMALYCISTGNRYPWRLLDCSLRAILPGAPDFGAVIDLIGIIPNIIVISLCTTVFAVSKLRMRRSKEGEEV